MTSSTLLKAAKNPDEMRDIAAKLCRDFLPGAWKTVSIHDLQLKRISGGLSNFLYHVSLPDDVSCSSSNTSVTETNTIFKRPRRESLESTPKEVLLRIYGQVHGEQTPDSLITDNIVFALLSERKLGPKLHGIFPGGRIEQYIPARALLTTELSIPSISCKIAEKMATIHSLDIPISKEPDWLWNTMERWLQNIDATLKHFDEKQLTSNKYPVKVTEIDFRKEADWLRQEIVSKDYPVVFSHNDMQEGNILLREEAFNQFMEDESTRSDFSSDDSMPLDSRMNDIYLSGENNSNVVDINLLSPTERLRRKRTFNGAESGEKENSNSGQDSDPTEQSLYGDSSALRTESPEIMIIDFEYCAYNYRSFDLANHFLEWTIDYTNPSYPYFHHFSEYYATREQQIRFITTYLKNLSDDYQLSMTEVEEILVEIEMMTLASHLFWSLWSFVNLLQEIEFGYLEYGHFRLNEYLRLKQNYINKYHDTNANCGAK